MCELFIIDSTVIEVDYVHLGFSNLLPDLGHGQAVGRAESIVFQDECPVLYLDDKW